MQTEKKVQRDDDSTELNQPNLADQLLTEDMREKGNRLEDVEASPAGQMVVLPTTVPPKPQRFTFARELLRNPKAGIGVAIVVFFVGYVIGYSGATVAVIVTSLAVGSVVLAPAIVFSYAVRAAEREDRDQGGFGPR